MTIQKEIEFKNLLEKEEFDRLCLGFGLSTKNFHSQTNTYFDTIDFQLRNAMMGFRLRVVGDRNELTLKAPGENIHTMLETTCKISANEREQILHTGSIQVSMYEEFHQLPDELQAFGTLHTERAETPYQDGLLVLDRSHYLGHTDFEMEFEVTDLERGQQSFMDLLENYKIPKRLTAKKIARFMKAAQQK